MMSGTAPESLSGRAWRTRGCEDSARWHKLTSLWHLHCRFRTTSTQVKNLPSVLSISEKRRRAFPEARTFGSEPRARARARHQPVPLAQQTATPMWRSCADSSKRTAVSRTMIMRSCVMRERATWDSKHDSIVGTGTGMSH